MSLMKCDICDYYVDTDDGEGLFAKTQFICGVCLETRCPECGATESCYECATKGGWSPE